MHPEQQPLLTPSPRSCHPILRIVIRVFKVDGQIRVVLSDIAVPTIQAYGTLLSLSQRGSVDEPGAVVLG